MPEKPVSEKTEQPTQKKLDKAKEKGQTAQSEEIGAVLAVVALLLTLIISGKKLLNWCADQIQQGFSAKTTVFTDNASFTAFFNAKITDSLLFMLPTLTVLAVAGITAGIITSGFNFAPQALTLKLDAINHVKGFEKLFNIKSLVKLLISVAKLTVIILITWRYLNDKTEEMMTVRWAWSWQIMTMIAKIISALLIRISCALIAIAAADVIFQKWKHIKELMMTKQEVKEERKNTDGSLETKARIRRIQIETSRKIMMQEVPNADVIIVNPTHIAVALKYDTKNMDAPVMIAKGADLVAEKIREVAKAYGVPIVRKPELARTIYKTTKTGQTISTELYKAVAEVLAMVYRIKQKKSMENTN